MTEHNELNLGRPSLKTMPATLFSYFLTSSSDDKFHFVSVKNLDDRTAKRLAQSHAVARGLENKRKLQQKSGLNFRGVSSKDDSGRNLSKRKRIKPLVSPPLSLSTDASSAFQMLAAESPKLQALFSQRKVFASAQTLPVEVYIKSPRKSATCYGANL
jgi:hypothetical protein